LTKRKTGARKIELSGIHCRLRTVDICSVHYPWLRENVVLMANGRTHFEWCWTGSYRTVSSSLGSINKVLASWGNFNFPPNIKKTMIF